MLFTYKAKLKNGEIFEGTMEATDRFSLSHELKSRGNTPISITEKRSNFFDLSSILGRIFSRVKADEQIIFTKNLSGMLRAGLSLFRALSVLKKQTKNTTLDKILTSLSNEINAGGTLSSGLEKFPEVFSKLFVSMTRAGEESGNLSNALSEIGVNLEKSHSLTKKIRGALIYPGVILSAMVLIGILMFAFVVPTLANTFKELGVQLPVSTRFIIALGNFFSQYLILSFALIIGSVAGIISLVRASFMEKYVDFIIIRLPIVGNLSKELNTARTTGTMSSLLLSGVSITRAIEITEDVVQNIYYKRVLKKAKEEVEKGAPFSKVFEENPNLFPVMMSEMIQVGEETGKLSDMLLQVASFYEGEIENKTKNLSIVIEPVLMVVIGAAVGFFAISMISPLYSIMDNIK
ncbi:MAG: Type II secretion system protein [Candidatus Nomurabacteria bacterium GW2011_GWF2_35_12]|uniref:Type II secretion system protein n=2 Tax=Candidatus Nomuraibacteriota TaxID=1752729 RepID=A0A0G0GER8_9BACT|nr:MAG: Type II secretion system protein [Candidatus Nomurabacteria bacterium GW2011_GWF2_35_12]KKP72273.1 MAG: Type II secretion system protein [Candidatus Nomurabacteria bacterium GW2011_GWB1_35_20]KKP74653.1 MAG: Type II secretion system protein [Parcubacteria group bacterium GW2011_GWC1_35_21]KKP77883.1 MAG: Type II secretion system protein [Candidatus Nomurabacteria bacterium GW2011_GWC2_35_35]KKP98320.1 MAG: Type II secretion system protein [Candidatus Nomurabacteria bacterium GW2011_GWA1